MESLCEWVRTLGSSHQPLDFIGEKLFMSYHLKILEQGREDPIGSPVRFVSCFVEVLGDLPSVGELYLVFDQHV